MADQVLTTQMISEVALPMLQNNHNIFNIASRKYQNEFTKPMAIGETLRLRKLNFFDAGIGQVTDPQGLNDAVENLTINYNFNWSTQINSMDLALDIRQFKARYLDRGIAAIINKFDRELLRSAASAYLTVGDTTSRVNSFGKLQSARSKLVKNAVIPQDLWGALSIEDAASLRESLQNYFNLKVSAPVLERDYLGELAGIKLFDTQNINQQVAALPSTTAGITVATQVSGENITSITLTGFTPGITVANWGDLIRIGTPAGYALPIQQLNLESKSFAGQATLSANPTITYPQNGDPVYGTVVADGAGVAVFPVSEPLYTQGGRANIQVIPAGTEVTFVGSHTNNFVMPSDALDLAIVPMAPLYSKDSSVASSNGVSLRVTLDSDTKANVQFIRVDVLAGWKFHPQYITRLISKPGVDS
jgi:hypothetical protein